MSSGFHAKIIAPDAIRFEELPPLALYIHIPWCIRKCPYCDFNSHEARDDIPERAYVEALLLDLQQAIPQIWGRKLHSIFFGGGTPSLFSAESIDNVLSAVRALIPQMPYAEVTLEANPGTFEVAKFGDYKAAGVNRLSLGIQSFDDASLQALGRVHDGAQARSAAVSARTLFDNINLDLMYALPGQDVPAAVRDVKMAIDVQPAHLSHYHLTIEPNTAFASAPPVVPSDDLADDMQTQCTALLNAHGYRQYETSAYATQGFQAKHNLNYWTFGDYLGIGAGAHSKLSFRDRVVREARFKHPKRYIAAAGDDPVEARHELKRRDLVAEFMMNALRLTDGFSTSLPSARTGLAAAAFERGLQLAEARGFIERDLETIRPTLLGQRFLNDAALVFMSA